MYPVKPFRTVRMLEGAGESVSYISLPSHARATRFSASPGGASNGVGRTVRPSKKPAAPNGPRPPASPADIDYERNKINIWLRSRRHL